MVLSMTFRRRTFMRCQFCGGTIMLLDFYALKAKVLPKFLPKKFFSKKIKNFFVFVSKILFFLQFFHVKRFMQVL